MRLQDYLSKNEILHTDFANEIGVSQAAVSRYSNGKRIPQPQIINRIEAATNGLVTWADHYAAFGAGDGAHEVSNSSNATDAASVAAVSAAPVLD